MPPAAFEEILCRISGSTRHVSLHVLGEPLLHPDLDLLLGKCRNHGLLVNLTTNGTLLARNRSVLIGQPALRQVNISLHSFEQPGGNDALAAYLEGIFDFIAAAVNKSIVHINLRMWNIKLDATAAEQDINSRMLKRLQDHFGLEGELLADIPAGRSIGLAPQVFLSRERSFTWPHGDAPDLGTHGYCRGLRDHIAILVDGTVVPCCLDAEGDIPLGNVFAATLPEILAGPRAATIIAGFDRQRVVDPVCRRCTYRQRFRHNNNGGPSSEGIQRMAPRTRNAA